jgi:hypothetical protein
MAWGEFPAQTGCALRANLERRSYKSLSSNPEWFGKRKVEIGFA